MKAILLKHCTLVSMNPKENKIQNNIDILIREGKISKIASGINNNGAETIDCNDKVIIPGMINCHTHIPMSLFRELVDGYSLQDWLTKAIWPIEAKLKVEDIYWFSLLSMCESIENGVTTINDMYFMTEEIIKATKKCGIDCVSTVTLLDSDGKEGGERRKQNFINFVKTHPNEKITLGVHGLYTNSPKYLKECVELAKKLKINLLHMHFCENKSEVETIKKVYNVKHPSDVLKKYFKGFKLVLGHCVILDDQDFKTLNQLKASIVHNPVSNFRLGCGFADLVKMQKHKINITLGTDGQGSGSNLSILNSARLACLMPKAINNDPTVVTAYEALQMATINGAKALGLEKSKGSIEVGKDADLVIFNFKHTQLFPINDLISDIIYNANGEDTETVIIKGKTVYKNKKFANINIKGLIEKCKDIKNNILKK